MQYKVIIMELIDKSALVAEIRKRLLPVIRDKHYDEWEEGQDSERIAILDIIDTLEVKEWSEEDSLMKENNNLSKRNGGTTMNKYMEEEK